MDISKALGEARAKQQEVVNELNQLEARKQQLIQEALRLDGEIRAFSRLNGDKPQEPHLD